MSDGPRYDTFNATVPDKINAKRGIGFVVNARYQKPPERPIKVIDYEGYTFALILSRTVAPLRQLRGEMYIFKVRSRRNRGVKAHMNLFQLNVLSKYFWAKPDF